MEFDHEFSVAAPIDAVWTTITDSERVAPCLPNTRVTKRVSHASCDVEITAAVGLFEITAQGNITRTERDDGSRREVLRVVADDADGDTLAAASVTIALTEVRAGTAAAVHSSVDLGGIGVLVSADALDQVAPRTTLTASAENLEALLRPAPNAAA